MNRVQENRVRSLNVGELNENIETLTTINMAIAGPGYDGPSWRPRPVDTILLKGTYSSRVIV